MAERSQYQYTPIQGPVWREPVASRMQWLPEGQQPARSLPPNRLGDYVRPEFAALYKPEGLQWLTPDRYAGRAFSSSKLDWTVFPVQVTSAAFDPKNLEWIPSDRYAGRPFPYSLRRPYSVAVVALDASLLSWQPTDRYFGRSLPRASLNWTVFPVQFTAPAFDPQNLEWIPKGVAPQVFIERRKLGDFTQPAFESLYKPERLQWILQGQQPARNLAFVRQSSWVIDPTPIVVVPFDPQFFPFESTHLVRAVFLPRALVGDYSTPPLPPGPDVIVVVTDRGTFNLRPRRRKKKKIDEVEVIEKKEYSPLPEVAPEHLEALAKALAEHGIPINQILLDYEIDFDEEDALIQATKIILQ